MTIWDITYSSDDLIAPQSEAVSRAAIMQFKNSVRLCVSFVILCGSIIYINPGIEHNKKKNIHIDFETAYEGVAKSR